MCTYQIEAEHLGKSYDDFVLLWVESIGDKFGEGDDITFWFTVIDGRFVGTEEALDGYVEGFRNIKGPATPKWEPAPKCGFIMTSVNNDYAATVQGISKKTDINETSWVNEDSAGMLVLTGEVWHIYDDLYLVGRKDIEFSDPDAYEKSKGGYMRDNNGIALTDPVNYWTNYAGHNIIEPTIVFVNNDQDGEDD